MLYNCNGNDIICILYMIILGLDIIESWQRRPSLVLKFANGVWINMLGLQGIR
jgi:hypothetical protein